MKRRSGRGFRGEPNLGGGANARSARVQLIPVATGWVGAQQRGAVCAPPCLTAIFFGSHRPAMEALFLELGFLFGSEWIARVPQDATISPGGARRAREGVDEAGEGRFVHSLDSGCWVQYHTRACGFGIK